MKSGTEIIEAAKPFLSKRGQSLLLVTYRLILVVITPAGLGYLALGQKEIVQTTPSRAEFDTYKKAQADLWEQHERRCEDILKDLKFDSSRLRQEFLDMHRSVMELMRRRVAAGGDQPRGATGLLDKGKETQ